ncbi:DUF2304 domain-containing protein [Streptococcus phocae subsp. phocae]|uniref:Glycosyl transferase n=1 Tax=Streptococcus phocae TaxID=119224 RepID=A0A0P6S715_9STRE|nr:DUF2304 domain-containing protein [Streptococcus phocae]KPJ22042.1 glycosyl transferase [Streptococcus phocae]
MVFSLQVIFIVTAIITATLILGNIRKSNIHIEDSFFWLLFSGILLFFAIFPKVIIFFAKIIGFESPANFVFLAIIFLLIIQQYRLTNALAKTEIKLKNLIQYIALKEKENDK